MNSTIPTALSRSTHQARTAKTHGRSPPNAISTPSAFCGSLPSQGPCMNHLMFIFGNMLSIHTSGRKTPLPRAKRHFASSASPGTISIDQSVKTLGQLLDTKNSDPKSSKNVAPNAGASISAPAASDDASNRQDHHQSKYREAFKSLESSYINFNARIRFSSGSVF